jgi:hypothetical protein
VDGWEKLGAVGAEAGWPCFRPERGTLRRKAV